MVEPFLKWPGGKRWLVQKYPQLLPVKFRRYIEPFLGGGAIFFSIRPENAILSDANIELVNAYNCLKDQPAKLEQTLRAFQKRHCISFYYKMRLSQPRARLARAARFLYLNRTCFNGIYRVNLKGQFNVPIGSKTRVAYPVGYLSEVAAALNNAEIFARDFESTISLARSGDFLYVDPPYTVMHNNNNFVKYNDVLFSWHDQERLCRAVHLAADRGAMVFVSNADHPSVRTLYHGLWRHHTVSRSSILAAASDARRPTTEIAITNYI